MSYRRNYRERLAVPYSGKVRYSYPPSEKGGSGRVPYSGIAYEDVFINIELDTDEFDDSVENCNDNVNLLTGAVVATEVAQIASIHKNSGRIAKTIVDGFFAYIRSEISQQITELMQSIDSQLMHLRELSKAVVDKKQQMEGDFLRISSRYIKTFNSLNSELSNRIYELDKAAFAFKKELDKQFIRTCNNDLVNTVAIFGKESGELQSRISASIAKKRSLDTINKARAFLNQQKKLNNVVRDSMLNENLESTQFSPVCFVETKEDKGQISKVIYTPPFVASLFFNQTKNELIEQFRDASISWSAIQNDHVEKIYFHFNSELNKSLPNTDKHSLRVKQVIQKISNLGSIQVLSNADSKY